VSLHDSLERVHVLQQHGIVLHWETVLPTQCADVKRCHHPANEAYLVRTAGPRDIAVTESPLVIPLAYKQLVSSLCTLPIKPVEDLPDVIWRSTRNDVLERRGWDGALELLYHAEENDASVELMP